MSYKILLAAYRPGNIQLLNEYYEQYLKDDMWGLINVVFQDYGGQRPKRKLFPLSYAAVVSDAPTPLFRKGAKGYYLPDKFSVTGDSYPPALLKNVRRKNMKLITLAQRDSQTIARFAGDAQLPYPQVLPLGAPRFARLTDREYREQCRTALGVADRYVLLYTPSGQPVAFTKALDDALGAQGMVLLTTADVEAFANIRKLEGDVMDGLCAADMLLTQHAHLVEFLLTRRPIAFLPSEDIPDMTDTAQFPGPLLGGLEEAIPFAAQAYEGAYAFERERALRMHHKFHDGQYARRIWEMLLRDHHVSENTIAEFCK